MNRASYSRVPQSDAEPQDGDQAATTGGGGAAAGRRPQRPNVDVEDHKRQHRNRVEQCSTKVQAFLWMCAAGFMVYSTNLFNVVLYDDRLHRGWFNLGLFCFGIAIAMMLYAVVWLPYVKKIQYDVEVVSPRFIPVAAVVFTLQGLCFCVGLWPVFGLFTPAVLGLLFMGALMSTHFIPYL